MIYLVSDVVSTIFMHFYSHMWPVLFLLFSAFSFLAMFDGNLVSDVSVAMVWPSARDKYFFELGLTDLLVRPLVRKVLLLMFRMGSTHSDFMRRSRFFSLLTVLYMVHRSTLCSVSATISTSTAGVYKLVFCFECSFLSVSPRGLSQLGTDTIGIACITTFTVLWRL